MSTYSIVEARSQLPRLIDRALKGEGVVITRRGQPVVELKPTAALAEQRPRVSEADLEWLRRRRIGRSPAKTDAGAFVSRMRDEEWER